MEKNIRYTLGKTERLKSRKAIERLFKEGKSFSIFPFRVLYIFEPVSPVPTETNSASNDSLKIQAGFTASSRNFKKAVDRNRIKRLMRETYRLQKNGLQDIPTTNHPSINLFFIYVGKELPAYELVYEKMGLVLTRLIKLTGEKR